MPAAVKFSTLPKLYPARIPLTESLHLLYSTEKEFIMATPGSRPESTRSTLDLDNISEPDRQLGKGHGTEALGPSDTSDSGSDIVGGPGWSHQVHIDNLGTGTTSDPEESTADYTAGPDVGDANLDSDSDSVGTGEAVSASRDQVTSDGQDIDTDRIDSLGGIVDPNVDKDVTDEDVPPPHKRH
jgi:hypothetical protein